MLQRFAFRKIGVAAVAASAIAAAATTTTTFTTKAWAADKPVFGLVMSFSGWFAPIDADTIAGAKLAVGEINAAGGVLGQPIEVVEFDNKSEPLLGPDGAVDVIGKGAKAILFPSDFDFGAPGAYVAQEKGVVAFSGASDPKFGVQGVGSLAYSTSNASQAQGALLAEWGYKHKGWKTAYVLLDNTIAYTKSLCASFAARWTELAGKDGLLGQDTFLNGDPSIAAQVTRVTSLSKKPDMIFFCSYAPGGPSAMRQLRAAGVDAPIVTGESLDGDYWIGSIPDLSNFYVISYGSKYGDDPDAAVNGFFKRFEAKYGKKADVSYGLRGYAAVQAWAEAANKAGSLDGAKVAAVLDTFNKQPLIIGPTTYTSKLHIQTTRPMAILAATNGKFACVGRFTVETFPPLQ
jgi:branched-chain amino acid transport system substrate-binding protein